MAPAEVSRHYHITLPKEVRERMGIRPGDIFEVFQYENYFELVPVKKAGELHGTLRGIDNDIVRDRDREF